MRIEADKVKFPVLLSNGNEVGKGDAGLTLDRFTNLKKLLTFNLRKLLTLEHSSWVRIEADKAKFPVPHRATY